MNRIAIKNETEYNELQVLELVAYAEKYCPKEKDNSYNAEVEYHKPVLIEKKCKTDLTTYNISIKETSK